MSSFYASRFALDIRSGVSLHFRELEINVSIAQIPTAAETIWDAFEWDMFSWYMDGRNVNISLFSLLLIYILKY